MKPIEHMSTMATLDLAARLTNGDMALPLFLQAVAFFLQEDIGQHRQGPEAHDRDGAHQLILIQAQFFLAIAKEHFNVPASSDMGEQQVWTGVQITRSEVTRLRERGIQRLAHDHHLAEVELAHPRGDDMHIHLIVSLGPLDPHIVARTELGCIVRQLLPGPSLRCSRVFDAQPAIAFESSGNQEATRPCCSPEHFRAVPGIEQDMGHRSCDRLKGADGRLHQFDLAAERNVFRFADRLLSIQLRSQGTASSQQYIQTLDQAMTRQALVLGGRMMQPQSFHLPAFGLVHRRVIPNQIPCHDGLFGTTSMLCLPLALSLLFCCDLGLHHLMKVSQPTFYQRCCFPRGFRQKTAQSCQTWSIGNPAHQSRERSRAFTQHQPQQHGHEVLVLRLTQVFTEPLGKVVQHFIQTYNGDRHGSPPWSQGFIVTFLIPHGVPSYHLPLQKCKHRGLGQQARLMEKLTAIQKLDQHTFPGTVARYVVKGDATLKTLQILLIWKTTEMPDETMRKQDFVMFQKELADVLDWETAQTSTNEVIIQT